MQYHIPKDFISSLLIKTDLVDLINDHVPLKKAGREYVAKCPFHEEKTPSFSVSKQKQVYHCFGCGASSNAIGFVMEYHGLRFVEAIHYLADRHGLDVPKTNNRTDTEGRDKLYQRNNHLLQIQLESAKLFESQLWRDQIAINYLKSRGWQQLWPRSLCWDMRLKRGIS
nr:CHC2 zinc finger domain-containing protein [Methylomarinum sp. Ch1-1]MDP4518972.1 CHC2 zinc finger domain-containing protein [Methylomarinum sp. Ch1-1]MDP4523370.1 CHC2 zinc finger domain-containing protein [Methylomarinum sp. Ch1-1]